MSKTEQKRALILGVSGQDGSYLAEILLERGYEVHGMIRRSSSGQDNLWRLSLVLDQIKLYNGDLTDPISIQDVILKVKPDELYNEADQDDVSWSFNTVHHSMDVTAKAVATVLDTVLKFWPVCRVFQPLSATMFGDAPAPQDENTPFNPLSPYACAKVAAYHLCRFYRQTYGLHVSTAIFYNHDSPRRRGDYLLQRICRQAIEVSRGQRDVIEVGNPDALVDISYAKDCMDTAHEILLLDTPDDFCVGSGSAHEIRQLCYEALGQMGVSHHPDKIRRDENFNRTDKVTTLVSECIKAASKNVWRTTTSVRELINIILKDMKERI